MRQRILGSHTPPCHRRMVITTQFNVLPCCTAAQTSLVPLRVAFECALAVWASGHLGQLAPTTLPQCRLAWYSRSAGLSLTDLSLCGPLSLSLRVSSSSPPLHLRLTPHTLKGVSLPLRPRHQFLSVSLFPVSLPLLTPPPPFACRYNSGIPAFARRRAQQRDT